MVEAGQDLALGAEPAQDVLGVGSPPAVLGFDNLLYISLESKRAPAERQAMVQRTGIGLAIVFRIVLLFLLMSLIRYFQDPVFGIHWSGVAEGEFNLHSLIVLFGGAFIIYTATKEIWHMTHIDDEMGGEETEQRSVRSVIFWIVLMNLVFSFDSILSAMALSDTFWVMASAIVAGGLLMIWLADRVSDFLQKNRMYDVLGLFLLFVGNDQDDVLLRDRRPGPERRTFTGTPPAPPTSSFAPARRGRPRALRPRARRRR